MALDFPASPTVGQLYPTPAVAGVPTYSWDGEKWATTGGGGIAEAPIDGKLYGRASSAWQAGVKLAGDTMSGHLSLPTGPAAANAARKDYVDATAVPPATVAPVMDGTATVGIATKYAREDHIHPTDTSRAAASIVSGPATVAPVMDGTATVGTTTKYAREDHIHPTDTSRAATSALPVTATAAEYLANSAPTKMLTSGATWGAAAIVTLTDGATVTPDFNTGLDFAWTLGAVGRTLANPTNTKVGQKGIIYLIQDGTGNRTITTWGSAWKFPGGTKPTLSTAASSVDAVSYVVRTSSFIACTFSAGFA